MIKHDEIQKLNEMERDIAVTITMNLNEQFNPKNAHDELILKNMVGAAEDRLLEKYSKREVFGIIENLKNMPDAVEYSSSDRGLVLFAADDFCDYATLPFFPGNAIKIARTFATRTLIRALSQLEHYYILCLSQNEVRLIECYDNQLIAECGEGFPILNETFYSTDRHKNSFFSAQDKIIQAFFRTVEEELNKVVEKNPLPFVLAGTGEAMANYEAVIGKEKLVIGKVRGNYDSDSGTELKDLIVKAYQVVSEYKNSKVLESMNDIDEAKGKKLVEYDLNQIYHLAQNGQVRELVVDEDYYQSAILSADDMLLLGTEKEGMPVDDVANFIIQIVSKFGGDIVFVPPYSLSRNNRLTAILRWR